MKTLTFTHYTVKDINPEPWRKTWETLEAFCKSMAPKAALLDIRLAARQVELEDYYEDSLMCGNLVTVACPDGGTPETPIEDILGLELDFAPCEGCVTPAGGGFPCRMFRDSKGEEHMALPEAFFTDTFMRTVFRAKYGGECGGSCASCAGCEKEHNDGTH